MNDFLFHYLRLEPPVWVFLSSFLVIGLFLMFHRFWSLRNLDILLILLFTPGILLVYEGANRRQVTNAKQIDALASAKEASESTPGGIRSAEPPKDSADRNSAVVDAGDSVSVTSPSPENPQISGSGTLESPNEVTEDRVPAAVDQIKKETASNDTLSYIGYFWLIVVAVLLVIRMLLDTSIVRRPMLDPNLSSGGMLFLGISMLVYLLVNVALSKPSEPLKQGPSAGPGYILMTALPSITTVHDADLQADSEGRPRPGGFKLLVARSLAIGANLVMVLAIVAIGYWHFGNLKTGVGVATFYLLLPYTLHMTGRVDHVLPSALLLLAVLLYRQPFAAGLCIGCAAGVVYYPFSLLPLWCSFYWQRGIRRFTGGFFVSIGTLVIVMIAMHPNDILQHLGYMFGVKQIAMTGMDGIWGLGWNPMMRIPLILLFVLLSVSFVAWPPQKSLSTLMSCSAALMAATQCWHGFGGGLYLAWFLPLALLTIFRPNLDYCLALEVVKPRRRKVVKAAPPVENANAA
ncbi:MAG: hypothetical protein MUC43_02340 [Pirellula sp.]|jgi:hypothetical protein|nr:hypothetical protein [Pirellula sp.]